MLWTWNTAAIGILAAMLVVMWVFVILIRRDMYRAITAGMKAITDMQRKAIDAECQKRHNEYDLYRQEVQDLLIELKMLIQILQDSHRDPANLLEAPLIRLTEVEEQLSRR